MGVMDTKQLIHICLFPIVFSNSYPESERHVMEEIQTEPSWEEKAIEVLEQILTSKIDQPPPSFVQFPSPSGQNNEVGQKVRYLSRHVDEARLRAGNILAHIKERNATASESLWETSGKSAREARALAEYAASFTKDVVKNLSEEAEENAVKTIASHIKTQIGSNNYRISQFHNSQKTTGAVLVKASKNSSSQLSNLKSEITSFRSMAKRRVDAVRNSAEADLNQTIKYLHLAESFSSSSEEIQMLYAPLDEVAAFAKKEAVRHAHEAAQESLNDVQKKFDSFKGVSEKPKHFEGTLQHAFKKTKSDYEETMKSWTKTNNDAMGISRTFFKFTEVRSVLERAKSAIDRAKVDIDNAKHSSKWEAIEEDLEKMSYSVDQVESTGRDLGTFHTYQSHLGSSMYGIWAQFYGYRAKRRVLRLKSYLSRINQTNHVEPLAEEDLREAVAKWDTAKKDDQHVAEISLAAVEEATHEMKQSVDLVQAVFHALEAKAKAINENYRKQCFGAFREAEDILRETNLAVSAALDEIMETASDNFHKTKILVLEAEAHRKWIHFFFLPLAVVLAGVFVAALFRVVPCKKLFPAHHAYLADIKTEEDLLKLSEAQMKEVLEMCGIEIIEEKYVFDEDEASKCKVCMDADIDCVILDCGHLVTCNQCGKKLTECPICRQQVLEVVSVTPVTEQDMMKLTTQQVKHVLTLCGIGFKDRVSARGRMEEGALLEKEHKCKVCMERVVDCVFLSCGHLMACTCCARKLINCPICQKRIARVARIYRT